MKITIQSTQRRESFTFSDEVKVEEAVNEALKAFDFPAAHRYELLLSGNTSTLLDADRTFASCNIHDGAILFLTISSC